MAQKPPHIQALQEEFLACRKLFTALGDETRQELLCALLAGPCQGSRGGTGGENPPLPPGGLPPPADSQGGGHCPGPAGGTYIYYYLNPQDGEIQRVFASLPVHSAGDGLCARPGRGTITHCRKGGEPRWNCGEAMGAAFGPGLSEPAHCRGSEKEELEAWIAQCNREGGPHMQLILDEPRAFSGDGPVRQIFRGAKLHCGGWPQRPLAGGGLRLLRGKRWC